MSFAASMSWGVMGAWSMMERTSVGLSLRRSATADTSWVSTESMIEFTISALDSDICVAAMLSTALLYLPTFATSTATPSFSHRPPRKT